MCTAMMVEVFRHVGTVVGCSVLLLCDDWLFSGWFSVDVVAGGTVFQADFSFRAWFRWFNILSDSVVCQCLEAFP